MTVAVANSNIAYAVTGSSVASVGVTFPNSATTGNFLIAMGSTNGDNTQQTNACWSSSPANTFVFDQAGDPDGQVHINISHVQSAADDGAGQTTITFTPEASDWLGVAILECSGVAAASPKDDGNENTTNTANPNTNAMTTSAAGIRVAMFTLAASQARTIEGGWSDIFEDTTWTATGGGAVYKIDSTIGSISHTWTATGGVAWWAAICSYKEAVAGGGSTASVYYLKG